MFTTAVGSGLPLMIGASLAPVPEMDGLASARSMADGKRDPPPQAVNVMLVQQTRQATAERARCPAALVRLLIGKINLGSDLHATKGERGPPPQGGH